MSKKFTIEDALKKPEGISPHNFGCCDIFGGSAFDNWCMLYKHKGIFIGFQNHDWVAFASSDPKAEWHCGCQNARAYGDPRPWSDTARLVALDELPPEAQELACQWVQEAIEICRQKIKEKIEEKRKEKEVEEKLKQEKYQKEVVDPWMEAVHANNP